MELKKCLAGRQLGSEHHPGLAASGAVAGQCSQLQPRPAAGMCAMHFEEHNLRGDHIWSVGLQLDPTQAAQAKMLPPATPCPRPIT